MENAVKITADKSGKTTIWCPADVIFVDGSLGVLGELIEQGKLDIVGYATLEEKDQANG